MGLWMMHMRTESFTWRNHSRNMILENEKPDEIPHWTGFCSSINDLLMLRVMKRAGKHPTHMALEVCLQKTVLIALLPLLFLPGFFFQNVLLLDLDVDLQEDQHVSCIQFSIFGQRKPSSPHKTLEWADIGGYFYWSSLYGFVFMSSAFPTCGSVA